MILGKVVGTVVTTISHPDYKNRRLLVVQPLGIEDEALDEAFVALDSSHAGVGDTVLVNREGNGARQVLKNPDACVISVIVGIIDSTYCEPRAALSTTRSQTP
jgi:ethanolamine utilization protein EutN